MHFAESRKYFALVSGEGPWKPSGVGKKPTGVASRHNGRMNLKPPFDRITVEPGKMGGQACVRGLRITIRRVLEILATYQDRHELFSDYPDLEEADLQQALAFAAAAVDGTIDLHQAADCGIRRSGAAVLDLNGTCNGH